MGFDPKKYGLKAEAGTAEKEPSFDPSKYGLTPAEKKNPLPTTSNNGGVKSSPIQSLYDVGMKPIIDANKEDASSVKDQIKERVQSSEEAKKISEKHAKVTKHKLDIARKEHQQDAKQIEHFKNKESREHKETIYLQAVEFSQQQKGRGV